VRATREAAATAKVALMVAAPSLRTQVDGTVGALKSSVVYQA